MTPVRSVRCPQCGKTVEWTPESRFRPFCSQRCKDIDLGAWASESYRIPVVDDEDEDGKPSFERD
ncbi:MAG: DNA gyrase inhibitor YacG [Casimicrobiaceae bacterium]